MTKTQLLENAKALPASERIDLAMEIWDTLKPRDVDRMIPAAVRREIRRRVASDQANPASAEDWGELRFKLLRGEI